jgi:hypothetical protein
VTLATTGAKTMSGTGGAYDGCEEASPLRVLSRERGGGSLDDIAIYLPSPRGSEPRHHRIVAAWGGTSLPVWCSGTWKRVGILDCPGTGKVVAYELSSDELPRLAVRQYHGLITFFDGDDLRSLHAEHYGAPTLANSLLVYQEPGDRSPRLAVGTTDGEVKIIDGSSYRLMHSFEAVSHNVMDMAVCAGPGGRPLLVVGGQAGDLAVFDPETGEKVHDLTKRLFR